MITDLTRRRVVRRTRHALVAVDDDRPLLDLPVDEIKKDFKRPGHKQRLGRVDHIQDKEGRPRSLNTVGGVGWAELRDFS